MIIGLNDYERQLLEDFRVHHQEAHLIIARVCQAKAEEARANCARYMSHVPRDVEVAANFAAHAEVYDRFMRELLEE